MHDVRKYFEYPTLPAFRADWARLDKTDKDQLKAGITDGTLTY